MAAFPAPVSHTRERFRLWRWSDVLAWAGTGRDDEPAAANLIAAVNAALEQRGAPGLILPLEGLRLGGL